MVNINHPKFGDSILQGLQFRNQMDDREREEKIRKAMESVSGDSDPMNNDLFSSLPIEKQNMIRQGVALDANLDEKQKKQRYNAMFKDFKLAENLLDNGLEAESVSLLQDRATNTDYGQDTAEILQAYQSGGAPSLKKYLSAFNNLADGKAKEQTATAQEKNFDRLAQLKQNGNEDEVAAFSKLIGLTNDQEMSSGLEKQIIKSQDEFFDYSEQSRKMKVLADDISRIDIGGGLQSSASETFKGILGSTDAVSSLRREFNAIRTSQATSNLPPGPASDKDIQLALSGFPAENANAATIISFLKGQEKLAKINAKFTEFKADYYAKNKSPSGMLTAWKNYSKDAELIGVEERDESTIFSEYGL